MQGSCKTLLDSAMAAPSRTVTFSCCTAPAATGRGSSRPGNLHRNSSELLETSAASSHINSCLIESKSEHRGSCRPWPPLGPVVELARCKRFSSPKHLLGHSRGSGVLRPSQVPSLVSTFRTGSTGSHCCHPCSKADGFRPEAEVTTSEVKPAWALSAPSRRAAGPFSAKTSGLRVASSHGERQGESTKSRRGATQRPTIACTKPAASMASDRQNVSWRLELQVSSNTP